MNLTNQIIIHKIFGEGKVIDHTGSYLTISFSQGDKKFIYPDSFKAFLRTKDELLNIAIQAETTESEAKNLLVLQEQERNALLEKERVQTTSIVRAKQKEKVYPRANIAFKCNYCDGGKSKECVGFNGVCSEDIINYNIKKAGHIWCSSSDCPCREFVDGDIGTYNELLRAVETRFSGFICYESIMLRDWRASAGVVQTGENKGRPMKLMKVQINSLAVLTTRLPYESDDSRFIFAVFLVDETYEGDAREEGYVSTKSKFKIQMTPDETQKLKFWNYYLCPNAPSVIKFGSGLHRYLTDEQAAQILIDIVKLKKGTAQEELAQEFLEYFCRINGVDLNSVSPNPDESTNITGFPAQYAYQFSPSRMGSSVRNLPVPGS